MRNDKRKVKTTSLVQILKLGNSYGWFPCHKIQHIRGLVAEGKQPAELVRFDADNHEFVGFDTDNHRLVGFDTNAIGIHGI